MKPRFSLVFVVVFFVLLGLLPARAAEKLVIDFMVSSGQQRTAWVTIVNQFAKENPDITISKHEFGQEQYKRDFGARLENQQVDIAFWFAGERLREWAGKKLLLPFDDAFTDTVLKPNFVKTTYDATEIGGKVYGFPVSYYQWGFFYKKSLFRKLKIEAPTTWSEFLVVCETLKKANIAPTAVGAKDGWPAAAWFDYLDLRINGIEFHRKLLRGEAKFTEPRVRKIFDEWKVLLDKGYFLEMTMTQDWESVLPYLYRDRLGMALMGGFVVTKVPPLIAQDIGFFPFPRYAPDVPAYEEAPLDVLVLPAKGQNRAAAKRFLSFLGKSNALNQFNDAVYMVSPRIDSQASADTLAGSAKAMLGAAAGITFFFDRDAQSNMVEPAFQTFKKFLAPPHDAAAAVSGMEGRSP